MSDLFCHVRRDESEGLLLQTARCVRGEVARADECLYPPNPLSTLLAVLTYTRTCLRDPRHFSNPAQVLMVMTCLEEVSILLNRWREDPELSSEHLRITQSLERVERVQELEKKRFWRVVEAVGESRVRDRLLELWRLDIRLP